VQDADAAELDVGVKTQGVFNALLDGGFTGTSPRRWWRAVVDCRRTTREVGRIYGGYW